MNLEPINIATLSTWLGRATEGLDSETHKVVLSHYRGNSNAYLKLYDDQRQAIAELAAAQLGRAIEINIPEPFLVLVDTTLLPPESKYHGTRHRWAFASDQAGKTPVSFARLVKDDSPGANQLFSTWKGLDDTAAFDEWLANTDRNLGNILYDGHGRTFWLIDHGRALTGEYWPVYGIDNPNVDVENLLLDYIGKTAPSDSRRKELRDKSNDLMLRASLIDFTQLDKDGHFTRLDPSINRQLVIDFVRTRVHNTVALICQKIGIPDMLSPTPPTH